MPTRLLDKANSALLKKEARVPKAYSEPRVNPSDLCAYVRDNRRVRFAGRCGRGLIFKLFGVPPSRPMSVRTARIFRVGRFFEEEVKQALQDAGVFVAAGVRKYVPELIMSFELDIVALDPVTQQGVICENKTVKGRFNMMMINEGKPKHENLMQVCMYLDYIKTGARLKQLIAECRRDKEIADEFGDVTLNRIEVNDQLLAQMDDGPLAAKLFYEDREECEDAEFDISLYQDPQDGLTYPSVNGVPFKDFCLESVYHKRREIQQYWNDIVGEAKQVLAKNGIREPQPPEGPFGRNFNDPGYKAAKDLYWAKIGEYFRSLPPNRWPAADYEFKYSPEKLKFLRQEGLLRKGEITSMNKGERVGDFNCEYCDYDGICIPAQYPEYRNMLVNIDQVPNQPEVF